MPPDRGIWWPKAVLSLGPVDLSSEVPSKIVAFWTFHISLFVNNTAMVVNSYTLLYMCMEVMICQFDRSPGKVDDIRDP